MSFVLLEVPLCSSLSPIELVSKSQIRISSLSHMSLVDLTFISLICRFPEKNITEWRESLFSPTLATLCISCLLGNNLADLRSQEMKVISLEIFSVLREESSDLRS